MCLWFSLVFFMATEVVMAFLDCCYFPLGQFSPFLGYMPNGSSIRGRHKSRSFDRVIESSICFGRTKRHNSN